MSSSIVATRSRATHVALLPSAGMGHLAPFLCLAAALSARGCAVSIITAHPTVSSAESNALSALLSSHPTIQSLNLPLAPFDPSTANSTDPFFLRFEAIRLSAHLLPPLLAAATSVVIDVTLASAFLPVTAALPRFILFTSSASMLSFNAFFSNVGGFGNIPESSVFPVLHNPSHLFTTQFVANGRAQLQADGILVNTFQAFEPETLAAMNGGRLVPGFPPVIAIGPLRSPALSMDSPEIKWLDEQADKTVVYVSFGSRTALPREQMRELGEGLERSGERFLWVVKSRAVDREDEMELEELLGGGFLERVRGRGVVVKGWVEQKGVLRHRAVGGFVSHCGWNSVTEAAVNGVPVLAWPRAGDQRVNAEVVARSGLGIWVEGWSWEADGGVVRGEEIGGKVRELMADAALRASAARVAEEAAAAVAAGGSSDKGMVDLIGSWI